MSSKVTMNNEVESTATLDDKTVRFFEQVLAAAQYEPAEARSLAKTRSYAQALKEARVAKARALAEKLDELLVEASDAAAWLPLALEHGHQVVIAQMLGMAVAEAGGAALNVKPTEYVRGLRRDVRMILAEQDAREVHEERRAARESVLLQRPARSWTRGKRGARK